MTLTTLPFTFACMIFVEFLREKYVNYITLGKKTFTQLYAQVTELMTII